jgi:rhamnose utilization protein RhaD (predicted bifunctional aldolase and dehydrogenase)
MNYLSLVSEFSTSLGGDPLLVQGAGGNVSWKDKGSLYIKASGKWLANANKENIFVDLNLKKIQLEISNGNFNLPNHESLNNNKPSIETFLHALMPYKFVAHLHCVNSVSQLIQYDWIDRINFAFPSNNDFLFIDYYKPGEVLAKNILFEIQKKGVKKIIFLRNHGVIYGADNLVELYELIYRVSKAFDNIFQPMHQNRIRSIVPKTNDFKHPLFTQLEHPSYDAIKHVKLFWEHLEKMWEIVPDHVVFLHEPVFDDLLLSNQLEMARDFIFNNKNCLINKNISKVKYEQLIFYFNVIARVENFLNINVLNQKQILEVKNWDAEKYRIMTQN